MCVGSVDLSKVKAWLKSGPLAEDEEAQKQTWEPGEDDWTEEGIEKLFLGVYLNTAHRNEGHGGIKGWGLIKSRCRQIPSCWLLGSLYLSEGPRTETGGDSFSIHTPQRGSCSRI